MLLLAAVLSATTTLAVPGRASATPSIAADGRFVAVVWSASLPNGATDIFAAVSRDGAESFGAPVRVNGIDGDARVSGEQPPRVSLVARPGAAPLMVVVWTTKGARGTRIVESRSADGGRTFTPAAAIPGGEAAGNRGWEAIAVADGHVEAVWLDHRAMTSHDGHMSPEQSSLYFGAVDGTLPPRPITNGVCYCCKTALAVGADGALYAAWREVYTGNVRDIAFTVSRDGGKTFAPPTRVSDDNWILDGCPDDGPAIAVDPTGAVHIVWPTLVGKGSDDPTIALFYATSADGRHFTPRQRVPTEGLPHHPQITLRPEGVPMLAWDELQGGTRRAVLGVGEPDGKSVQFARNILSGGKAALYPVISAGADGVIAVWTSGGPADSQIEVRVKRDANALSRRR
jgi:hypothetical protein